MDQQKLTEVLAIARQIGWGAGDVLQSYYKGDIKNISDKKDGPVTKADLAANHYILEAFQEKLGTEDFAYLSEETYDGNKVEHPWVWIIDPLDGTRDFIDQTGEYAVHICLVHEGRPVIAVVVVPEAEKLYFASKGNGTFVETRDGTVTPIKVSERNQPEDLYLVASRTHRDQRFQDLLDRLPFKDRNYVGSVGCKIAHILEQKSDVYISLSGKSAAKDWDFAAPELILTEAGGKFSYFAGNEVLYNQGDVVKWGGIMASNGPCHAELCQQAIAILAELDRT
ncbi:MULTISPECIES: 3'(2'),5'-bisphosphate nucleotidase CysQ [Cyanophyceae]|uniref:3'(2'),5'-bisphosphate nucleotidase CysQ family protein n=1 Tax=Cyanophyceae TaxID=3028117 RepID=UPI00016DC58B|nr:MULTISPECIES: inositol monophosphatase family protein [Cyanophyceae]ACA98051.1 Inositol monophosphatase family [Picosynechococcus sp. PCC 7002]SMH42599.1 3'(2'), 5'-bisphosphate nucleotidase [Picosynechococcus sp. OG1]SMQ78779.1 3'(2'), 5'-bisphosphate nucleotidase [Synechococcus sp. 7002]